MQSLSLGAFLLGIATLSSACSSLGGNADDRFAYVEEPVELLYAGGTEALEKRRYDEAVLYFEEVERQHPYSAWARRAMLMTAYTQYLENNYEESLASIDRFLSIHPGNKDAAYAYYLRAMNHYERIRDVGRDQDITRNALDALQDVVRRYPDSEYARDARLKLDLTRDHLAGKEMDVGRWYLRRNQHVAAINRFNRVLTDYETTSHVPEALHRIVEAYLELGVVAEARRHAATLGYNYPDSEWYEDTYRLFVKRGLAVETDTLASSRAVEFAAND
jgi:outer membrane protein assembly factor BamD